MQLSFRGPEFAQSALIATLTVSAVALLGLVGAYWTWQWFAPAAEPSLPVQADASGQVASALSLFGTVQKESIGPQPTGMAIRLAGVVAAAEGREAFAVVILDGKQIIATRKGEEITPGITLVEVEPDHVVLDRNGSRESLAWPDAASQRAPGGANR
jgi:general secretion pathway protein C